MEQAGTSSASGPAAEGVAPAGPAADDVVPVADDLLPDLAPVGEAVVLRHRPPDPRRVRCGLIPHKDCLTLVVCESVRKALLRNQMTGDKHLFTFSGQVYCLVCPAI